MFPNMVEYEFNVNVRIIVPPDAGTQGWEVVPTGTSKCSRSSSFSDSGAYLEKAVARHVSHWVTTHDGMHLCKSMRENESKVTMSELHNFIHLM